MSRSCITLWRDLHVLAWKVAVKYGIKDLDLEPISHPQARVFGDCRKNGLIRIRVHVLGRPNRPRSWNAILGTLAHELAHLVDWKLKHGPDHDELTREILAFLKEA